MPTTTFVPDSAHQFVEWNDSARWSGGVVPNDPALDVVIPTTTVIATGEPYVSFITVRSSYGVKSLSISNNLLKLEGLGTLTIGNELKLLGGASLLLTGGLNLSAGSIDNHGQTITGTGTVTSTGLFVNAGNLFGSGLTVTAGSLTNTGSFTGASGDLTVNVDPGGFTNLSGSTLTGGSYTVGYYHASPNHSNIYLNVGGVIATNAANISIEEGGGIYSFDDISHSYVSITSSLHLIAAAGTLSLAHQSFSWSNLTVDGALNLTSATLGTTQLTVDASGTVSGIGAITGPIVNNGTILARYIPGVDINTLTDALVLGPVSGSGTLEIGAAQQFYLNGHYTYKGIPLELTAATSTDVVFDDGHGLLILDDVTHFTGTIKPADIGDRIIVKGTSLASVTSYDYVGDSSGGTLTVHTTGGDFDLQFLGNFTRADFSLTAGPQPLSSDPPSLLITQTDMGPQAPHDFNDDGRSDILWRNDAGGIATWDMNDGQLLSAHSLGAVPDSWQIAGTGDFNGDHHADILWRSDSGSIAIWNMNDDQILNARSLGSVPANWHIAGTGDFNGDGMADILWRNDAGAIATWDMNDGQLLSAHSLGAVPDSWQIAGTGDFNGDHKTDILWRNDAGSVAVWDMDDGAILLANSLGSVPNNWHIAGTGDFNGDQKTDILWRNDAGAVAIWDMNDGTILHASSLGMVPANWSIAGTGDFNGDQKTDIIWRSDAGPVAIWDMDDGTIISAHSLGSVPANWHIIV
jgi:hypothetical protein